MRVLDGTHRFHSATALKEFQHTQCRIRCERFNCLVVVAQGVFNIRGRAITKMQPNNLGRKATQHTHIIKIGVFGDNYVVVRLGRGPDREVRCAR